MNAENQAVVSFPEKLKLTALAIRWKTLSASFIPIFVGTALSFGMHKQVQLSIGSIALACSLFIQIGTNLINDALDFRRGADTEKRLGPRRLIQKGIADEAQVWWLGILCFLLATVLSLPLVYMGGFPIILIGLFSILAGYCYTGGPFPLAYRGLGDLFVLIFFGWVAVGGIYYLNTSSWDTAAFVAGTQVGLLATVMIAINNYRDYRTDALVHKKTLAVRFGPRFAKAEIAGLCFLPFILGLYWISENKIEAAALPVLALPLALKLNLKLRSAEPGEVFNRYLAQAGALQMIFGVLLCIGLILSVQK